MNLKIVKKITVWSALLVVLIQLILIIKPYTIAIIPALRSLVPLQQLEHAVPHAKEREKFKKQKIQESEKSQAVLDIALGEIEVVSRQKFYIFIKTIIYILVGGLLLYKFLDLINGAVKKWGRAHISVFGFTFFEFKARGFIDSNKNNPSDFMIKMLLTCNLISFLIIVLYL